MTGETVMATRDPADPAFSQYSFKVVHDQARILKKSISQKIRFISIQFIPFFLLTSGPLINFVIRYLNTENVLWYATISCWVFQQCYTE